MFDDSHKPKKAEQMVKFHEHVGSHNSGEVAGFTKAEADVLCAKRKDGTSKATRVYFSDDGKDITAEVEAKAAAEVKAKAEAAAAKLAAEKAEQS